MFTASQSIPSLSKPLGQTQPITFHPSSALLNPQISRLCFRSITSTTFIPSSATTTNSAWRWPKEARTVYSATGNRLVKGNKEYDEGESLMLNGKYPRPQEVPWQKELANRVHFIGVIGQPVKFKRTQSGIAFAWTELGIINREKEPTWFSLIFFRELAETAAQHLKQNDQVCVSGRLSLWKPYGEDNKPKAFQVLGYTLNFIKEGSLDFSQQVDVDKNTPFPYPSRQAVTNRATLQYQNPALEYYSSAPSRQEVTNRDTPLRYKTSTVESSSLGKNAQEDSTKIVSLWQAFFSSPFEWWDNRTNKRNPRSPDFKHKDSGEALWIDSKQSPLWVRSQLNVLDSKLKKWGGGSSAKSRVSLSSFENL